MKFDDIQYFVNLQCTDLRKLVKEVGGEAEGQEGLPRQKHIVAPGNRIGLMAKGASNPPDGLPSLRPQLRGVLLHLPGHDHLRLLPHHRHHLDGRQLNECFEIISCQGDVLARQQVDENLVSVCSLLRHLCLPWLHPWGAVGPDCPWVDTVISPDSSEGRLKHSGGQIFSDITINIMVFLTR